MYKVKDVVRQLQGLDQEAYFKVACDEEWNTIFNDFEIERYGKYGAFVIAGLSGSEEESYMDLATHKFNHNIEPGEGEEQCPNCGRVVWDKEIYTTHEDNEHPDNKTYCVKCQDTIKFNPIATEQVVRIEPGVDEEQFKIITNHN